MKFLLGLTFALAATIAWQTSVLSGEDHGVMSETVKQVQAENRQAGRVSFDEEDCD